MERAVRDRSAKLQSSIRERAPRVRLVEAASPSLTPWRPQYTRDALIAVAGSLVFALLATLLAEYLRGPAPARTLVVQHALAVPALGRLAAPAMQILGRPLFGPGPDSHAALPAPEPLPRELDNGEIATLIAHAPDDLRLAAMAILSGLETAEIAALRWGQITPDVSAIAVGGASPRTIALEGALAMLLKQRPRGADGAPVLANARGEALTEAEVDQLVSYGAYDAGLARPRM